MRLLEPMLVAGALVLGASCYERPSVPPDKPLSCTGTDASNDCPSGFSCIGQICAPKTCVDDTSCPGGLSCNGSHGCGHPESDGGAAEAGVIIGTVPDAAVVPVPPALDGSIAAVDLGLAITTDAPMNGSTPGASTDGGIR